MKAEDIIRQLLFLMPRYSTLFNDNIAITNISISGTTVTLTTATPHNLISGSIVNVVGVTIQNPLVSLTQIDNIATGETQYDHDLTELYPDGTNSTVLISGATEPDYNGANRLLNVPNRRFFTYKLANDPTSPATGTPILNEITRTVNPYNGVQTVTAVTSTTFSYTVIGGFPPPGIAPNTTPLVTFNMRISGAFALGQLDEEYYSKQMAGKYWLFVILGDSTVSQDRETLSNATQTEAAGILFRQRVITPFEVFCFAPYPADTSNTQLSGRLLRDQMVDVRNSLFRSLLRYKPPSYVSESQWAQIVFTGDGFYSYNQAYYIHRFAFECSYDIIYEDTRQPDDNVAFRDIHVDFQRLQDPYVYTQLDVNLDDDPL